MRACFARFTLTSVFWLACCVVGVPSAHAADKRPVELPLTNGKSITGVIESANSADVVVRTGPESTRNVPWSRLSPLAHYRVKAALASPTDGKERMKLGELAVDLGLYVQARIEYEKALALGAIQKQAFARVVLKAEHDAVVAGIARARKIAEAGDLDAAMETARQLKLHFAGARNAADIGKLISALLKQVHKLDQDASEAIADLKRIKLEARRNKEILTRKTNAIDLVRRAALLAAESKAKQKQGSVTRARKAAEAADKHFQDARRHLGRLRRILPREHPQRVVILAELNKLDKAQFDLLFSMAWFLTFDAGSYSKAERFAARASYIDPVHPDLVELRDHLLTNRIRYRVSDMTNARGRVVR